jgi:hypothetical protein
MIKVLERTKDTTAAKNLNKPMMVRTEMQVNLWAKNNNRSTPTPIGAR